MTVLEKEKKIKTELSALKRICAEVPENKKKLAYRYCEKSAFLAVSIEECQEDINSKGYYEDFQQSKDVKPYERIRPIVNTLVSLTSGYQKYMKLIEDLIPDRQEEKSDGFDAFSGKRDKS